MPGEPLTAQDGTSAAAERSSGDSNDSSIQPSAPADVSITPCKTFDTHRGWQKAGPGRPKGRQNNLTLQQRKVAEMVLGEPGTNEFKVFVGAQRAQALSGLMPAAILSLWLHYLLGKPVERVEVKDTTDELDNATGEQLRERAKLIAQRVVDAAPAAPAEPDESSVH